MDTFITQLEIEYSIDNIDLHRLEGHWKTPAVARKLYFTNAS